jgi:amidophosphoribosyltransferase
MSDQIKHECGIVFIKLKKEPQYYIDKYHTAYYGINKLYLMMQKQYNRGQDGAGVVAVNTLANPGSPYINLEKSADKDAIAKVFTQINAKIQTAEDNQISTNNIPFTGQTFLGHVRYATHSNTGIRYCHPFHRENTDKKLNLALAGNFNLTNNDQLFEKLISLNQHPNDTIDTESVLSLFSYYFQEAYHHKNFNIQEVTNKVCHNFDGGFAFGLVAGNGDSLLIRDPNGIRPLYFYEDDEVFVASSERPPIQMAFAVKHYQVFEFKPGSSLFIDHNNNKTEFEIWDKKPIRQCSFERIYFSRGNDVEIYQERKNLGKHLAHRVFKELNSELNNAVVSYIPNTAETSFLGLQEELTKIAPNHNPRFERIIHKDVKMRTFISADSGRNELVSHVYDTTYGLIENHKDNLIILDDSIVRGTTLKQSILTILARLQPKAIYILSSAPIIKYPDCYGIDMSKLKDFVAFNALINLLNKKGELQSIEDTYQKCKENFDNLDANNFVVDLYNKVTDAELEDEISLIITPENYSIPVKVIYQTVENLHKSCPNHIGDWYFTGNYPTPGGNRVANRAFVYYYEGKNLRAY